MSSATPAVRCWSGIAAAATLSLGRFVLCAVLVVVAIAVFCMRKAPSAVH